MIIYMSNTDYSRFIVITNRHLCNNDYIEQIKKVLSLHPYALILREKDLCEQEYLELAIEVQKLCLAENVLFFVHRNIDIANIIGCKNIHLSILDLEKIEDKINGFENISVSCHSVADVRSALNISSTQIVLGTIFETECKKGLKGKGTQFISEIREMCEIPIYAIGGIKEKNINTVIEAGATGGCMMSGFMKM